MPLPVCNLTNVGISVDLDLPVSFKYIPYVCKKRNSVKRTANSVVTQCAFPTQIVHGDGIISWRVEDCHPEEFEDLYVLYNTSGLTTYEFTGYWQDNFEVYFSDLKVDKVFGRYMSISGEFQVISIISAYAPYTGISCAT